MSEWVKRLIEDLKKELQQSQDQIELDKIWHDKVIEKVKYLESLINELEKL